MNIPLTAWKKYIELLRKVNDKATDLVRKYLETHQIPQTSEEMNALIDYAFAVSTKYGEASATAAAEMYDNIAKASKVKVQAAEPAETPEISEVAKTVVGTAKTNNPDIIADAIGRLVKRSGVDTTMQNAIRDGAEWAWIPQGDTCSFCIMLASNGWQKASKAALKGGHAEHIHANCDCTYAVRFNGQPSYEGYDPDKYRETYENAEGDTWQEKLNSMRRDEYAKNADMINARKRELYAVRKNGLDKPYSDKYNNSPLDFINRLRTVYDEDVETGWISSLCGFDNYLRLYNQVENEIVGTVTSNGITITGQSRHFLQRLIGTSRDPKIYKENHRIISRSGVEISDIAKALKSDLIMPAKSDENGLSQVFVGDRCKVSVNVETGKLIQCNPRKVK